MRQSLLPLLAIALIASVAPPAARAEHHGPAVATSQTPTLTRHYWPVPIDSLAAGHARHTHVAVRGVVTYTRLEDDGDLHIKLSAPSGAFIVAECIPTLPCIRPHLGDTITVHGISRYDPEHLWHEVHPVEELLR